ncbi:MAG TPA: sugar phosphate isomerase/epimerase family protein [Spirochaetia bacterium]|nr:sugar phosphate isomerase/epimerase family protein [Spirochaetia bacterium]
MKVGIDSYSYHRYFGEVYDVQKKPAKDMSYEDFLKRAVQLKVDGVSLETCFFQSTDESYLKRLKEIIDRGPLEVVVAWGHPKGFEGGKKPEELADLRRHFTTCRILGAKVMRVVGSSLDYRNDPHGPQIEKLTGIFKECAKIAGDEGVKLADENHYDFTMDEYLGLFEAVGSPHFGMCFDTGNCLRNGDEPVESARRLGRYIFATHTKDVMPLYGGNPKDWFYYACTPVGKGLVNFPGIVAELEKQGYAGLYAVEIDYPYPSIRDEDQAVKESISYLKTLQKSHPKR